MSNHPQAGANGSIRPPSPPTIEAANGLLNFVSNHPPNVPPQSLLASRLGLSSFPAAMHNASAATELAAMHRFMMDAASTSHPAFARPHLANHAPPMSVAQKREPLKNEDLVQAANPRRPCFNRPIDHPYTDYAPVSDAELQRLDQNDSILYWPTLSPEKKNLMKALRDMPSKCGSMQPFPSKLHEVVSNPELSNIISWLPHGRAFVVHDPDGLVEKVLPYYFSQTKFLSFIRQCNLWGFKRLTRGVEGKVYYHELFLRGRPYMSRRIKRHKLKSHGFKPMPNPTAEPNFYSFSPVDELVNLHANEVEKNDEKVKEKMVTNDVAPDATHPSQLFGVTSTDIKQDTGKKEKASTLESDSLLLTSCVVKPAVPPAAARSDAGSATNAAATKPGAKVNDQDVLKGDDSSVMCHRQAALSAAGAKIHSVNHEQPATKAAFKTDDKDSKKGDAAATTLRYHQAQRSASGGKPHLMNGEQAVTNVEARTNEEDPLKGDALTMLRYRQAALSAADAPASTYASLVAAEKHLLSTEATRARLAAITAAVKNSEPEGGANLSATSHYASLMNLGDIGGLNTGLNQYPASRSNMSDLLHERLVQLQREQHEIELLRRAAMFNDLSSRSGHSQLVAGFSDDPMPMSVAEALREAKHFEELATASRNRARILALAQSNYDNSQGRKNGGDQS